LRDLQPMEQPVMFLIELGDPSFMIGKIHIIQDE
jgi:hypothetical protein